MPTLPDQFYKETYPSEVFQKLCLDFELPNIQHEEIRESLEDFAAIWRWHTPEPEMVRKPSKDAKALGKVSDKAVKLLKEVEGLSIHAQSELEKANSVASMDAAFSDREHSRYGHKFIRYLDKNGLETTLLDDVSDLVRAVEILKNLADAGKANLTPMPTGRRHDMAMRMWMINIYHFWCDDLSRAFTRDATPKGEPLTQAAAFCIAAFAPIDPKTPNSRVLFEMKKVIAEYRKSSTGKNVIKNDS